MRLYLQILTVALCLSSAASAIASQKTTDSWEVLEGCTLVKSTYNDGDSFIIEQRDTQFIARLYFVDTPETRNTYKDRVQDQAKYFSISTEQALQASKTATQFSKKFLTGEFTIITKWEDARGSGKRPRYFALIQKNGHYLSEALIKNGHARIYGMPTNGAWPDGMTPSAYLKKLKQAEREAQSKRLGIWGIATACAQTKGKQLSTSKPSRLHNSEPKINLNTASQTDLETLPKIGPVLAERIIAARPIENFDALVSIPGISQKTLNGFQKRVTLKE